jgi:DnaK suppressor protein
MELEKARELLTAQRAQVQQLLTDLGRDRVEDESTEAAAGDEVDPAGPLTEFGVDTALADSLRDRLAASDRALQRLADGTYGRSVRSGAVIPDARLEADPAAELTVEEAAADEAAQG